MTAALESNLLAEYVQNGSKAAFEQIVTQYIHLVHAAALRQMHTTHIWPRTSATVFLLLAATRFPGLPRPELAAGRDPSHLRKRNQERMATEKARTKGRAMSRTRSIFHGTNRFDSTAARFRNCRSKPPIVMRLSNGFSIRAHWKKLTRRWASRSKLLPKRNQPGDETARTFSRKTRHHNKPGDAQARCCPAVAQQPAASQSLLSTVLTSHASNTLTAGSRCNPDRGACCSNRSPLPGSRCSAWVEYSRSFAGQPSARVTAAAPGCRSTTGRTSPQRCHLASAPVTLSLIDAKQKTPLADGTVELDMSGNRRSRACQAMENSCANCQRIISTPALFVAFLGEQR